MFRFFSAWVLMLALTASGFAQEDAKKPIVPEGGKFRIAEAAMKDWKRISFVNTPRGKQIEFEFNGEIYQVTELSYKVGRDDATYFVENGDVKVRHSRLPK